MEKQIMKKKFIIEGIILVIITFVELYWRKRSLAFNSWLIVACFLNQVYLTFIYNPNMKDQKAEWDEKWQKRVRTWMFINFGLLVSLLIQMN